MKYDYTIEAFAAKPDNKLMFTVSTKEHPFILFSYDDVCFVEMDGNVVLEYGLLFSVLKEENFDQEAFSDIAYTLLQQIVADKLQV